MALEDLLREAAKRGITHLSLAPTPSADGKHIYWCARATPSTEHKYISCTCEDPVDAVTQVLEALPKAKRRSSKPEPHLVQSELPVTATVIEEPKAVTEPAASAAPLNLEEEFASWLPKP